MRFRKLRIAWSVVWGVVALLLIVLWVRSYFLFSAFGTGPTPPISDATLLIAKGEIVAQFRWPLRLSAARLNTLSDLEAEATYRMADYKTFLGFTFIKLPNRWYYPNLLIVPFWLLVTFNAVLSSLPWMPRPKLKPRFGLGTLLIATTLVAVVLGLIVWALKN